MKVISAGVRLAILLMTFGTLAYEPASWAQSTAFTYQGQFLTNSGPYTGSAEFNFTLWDAPSAGNALATNNPASVIANVANGLFTVTLDFGLSPFNGQSCFLQTDVRTVIGPFTTLSPRQPLTPTPYALRAFNLTTNGLAAGIYGNAVTFNNAGDSFSGAFNGSFTGNGTSVTNVNAATLGGLNSSNFWKTGGNGGTLAGTQFLGTTDNQALELKVNNQRAFRLEPRGSSQMNIIGGSPLNNANAAVGATIGGGGTSANLPVAYASPAGGGIVVSITVLPPNGGSNELASDFSTIAGGVGNFIGFESHNAVIGGGIGNQIGDFTGSSFIGGGVLNQIQTSNSYLSVIVGGMSNNIGPACDSGVIAGGVQNSILTLSSLGAIGGGLANKILGDFGTIPGGDNNLATNHAFAAGHRASALHVGAFVWGDNSTNVSVSSVISNSVTMRAAGGYRLFSSAATNAGVSLASGGTAWAVISDRNVKKDFAPLDSRNILEKLVAVPISQWHYQWEEESITPHIGPMAQEFKAAFYPGSDDKSITTLEFDGVELAAIQGLNQKLGEKDDEIRELKQRLDALEKLVKHQDSN